MGDRAAADAAAKRMLAGVRALVEETGRPMHPDVAAILDGGVDPTARSSENRHGEVLTAELRSAESAGSYYAIEGCVIGLTPLGMLDVAFQMLQILSGDHGELPDGVDAAMLDPWGELAPFQGTVIPDHDDEGDVTLAEECRRAFWHVGRVIDAVRP